jgi:putative sterol carrier protein
MTASTAEFFDKLSRRGHEPLLEKVRATVRFDISDSERTEHWLVRIDHGDIWVSGENVPADCVISCERPVFDAVFAGRMSPLAALLRGAMAVDGDPQLLVLTQRLLPGQPHETPDRTPDQPPGRSPRHAAAGKRRSS